MNSGGRVTATLRRSRRSRSPPRLLLSPAPPKAQANKKKKKAHRHKEADELTRRLNQVYSVDAPPLVQRESQGVFSGKEPGFDLMMQSGSCLDATPGLKQISSQLNKINRLHRMFSYHSATAEVTKLNPECPPDPPVAKEYSPRPVVGKSGAAGKAKKASNK